MRVQAELDQLGVLGVVVVLGQLYPRIVQLLNPDLLRAGRSDLTSATILT